MKTIFSRDNQHLKLIRSLQQKKTRIEQGCFLAEGLRLSEEAAISGDCQLALFSESALAEPRVQLLEQRLSGNGVECLVCSNELFARTGTTEHPQGVLVVVRIPEQHRPQQGGAYYAYADHLSDPGNLGTIMRTAYAAGCSALLLSPHTADIFNPKTVRASMGAVFRLPLYQCVDDEDALCLFRELGAAPLIASADGTDIRCCSELLSQPHVWVLGAEADGVSSFWREHAEARISLPMADGAESLNVAAAAAVLLYQSFFVQQQ